jgi:hypothetical protein
VSHQLAQAYKCIGRIGGVRGRAVWSYEQWEVVEVGLSIFVMNHDDREDETGVALLHLRGVDQLEMTDGPSLAPEPSLLREPLHEVVQIDHWFSSRTSWNQ